MLSHIYQMSCFLHILLLTSFFRAAVTSPLKPVHLRSEHTSISKRNEWNWKTEDLNKEFLGIHWDAAFASCSPEQLNKVIFSTRAAMWMTALPTDPAVSMAYFEAWKKYFGDYNLWIRNGINDLKLSAVIQANIRSAAKFPKGGHYKSPGNLLKKIHFTCDFTGHGSGPIQSCVDRRAGAVTIDSGASKYDAWTIIFCPEFFAHPKLRYLEERTKDTVRGPKWIAFLDTYERALVHEFMHVDWIKTEGHIGDVKGALTHGGPKQNVYGSSACEEFAQRDISKGRVNREVAVNANGCGKLTTTPGFFQYFWYERKWGWHTKPHDELRKSNPKFDEPPPQQEPIVVPPPSFPIDEDDVVFTGNAPRNCVILDKQMNEHGDPTVECEDIGGDYAEWVKELPPREFTKFGCELTYQCMQPVGNAVNPKCLCICDGKSAPLRDERCVGFMGALPGRPAHLAIRAGGEFERDELRV